MAKICSITVAVLWAALCFASLAVAQHPNQVPDPRFLQECCEDATKPGALDFSRLCNLQYKPRHRHPHDQQCFITFHGCCEEQKATKHCEQGKEAATNGLECPTREKQGEDRPYVLVHDCCQACKEALRLPLPLRMANVRYRLAPSLNMQRILAVLLITRPKAPRKQTLRPLPLI